VSLSLRWLFAGIAVGLGLGGVANVWGMPGPVVASAEVLGELFLRLLRMIVVPLVTASIICGVLTLGDARSIGRLGARTLMYYLGSSLAAILTGILMFQIIRPGAARELLGQAENTPEIETWTLADFFLGLVPENPVNALAQGDMLAVILFAFLFGAALLTLPAERRAPLATWFGSLFDVMMTITDWVLRLAPVGVGALLFGVVAQAGGAVFGPLLGYALTVVLALGLHACVTLPLALKFLAGVPVRAHARAFFGPLLTAVSTASSSATLPYTMEAAERGAGMPRRVSGFVLPLGATVNMDGTALYEGVAVLFIAQVYGVDLTLLQQVTVVLTALMVSVGAAGIPMAGLVMMSIILQAVGLPLEAVGLILVVDRFLDMLRTGVNVWSDSVAAAVISRWEGAPPAPHRSVMVEAD